MKQHQELLDLQRPRGFTPSIVRIFLESRLPLILIVLAVILGLGSLLSTAREEDPQIVVPLADVIVNFPGHSAQEVEQLVATPLEKILFQIDGVEYVYSMSRTDRAIITVRFYVGEDRERSLVKLYKKMDESLDLVPPGVTGWVVRPVEIDDVPIVTLTLASHTADPFVQRRVAEEVVDRLAAVENISRAFIVGGRPRILHVYVNPDRLQAYNTTVLEVQRAIEGANVTRQAGDFTRNDAGFAVEVGRAFQRPEELGELVVGVFTPAPLPDGRGSESQPVFLKDVADIVDGPAEPASYIRHGWGPARGFVARDHTPGILIGAKSGLAAGDRDLERYREVESPNPSLNLSVSPSLHLVSPRPAVTIALSKKKGTNAVQVAEEIISAAEALKADVIPDNIDLVITRNTGQSSNDRVNELVQALGVALIFICVVLTLGLGWRQALIVAITVPVVFGLTLTVNMLAGYTINRVTLFALILSLGLLVDDPTVDVENISRHFARRKRASRNIVLQAVSEIRPPLIAATLAVIVSFLPMMFLTGMMGPYMRPMAINVPVAMLMSMLAAFTVTPWLAYHLLRRQYPDSDLPARISESSDEADKLTRENGAPKTSTGDTYDLEELRRTPLYRFFYPLMAPLLNSRKLAWGFMLGMAGLTVLAASLAVTRHVPLKMLPFGNKDQLQLVLDFDEGTTLERADAAVQEFERYLQAVPEITDFTAYVGVPGPMDFNGMVRHYYLREAAHAAEIQVNLTEKQARRQQSHEIALRIRDELTAIAGRHGANLKLVEAPPGPPVLSSLVAEVYGRPDHAYEDLIAAARSVRARLAREPGVVDVDDTIEAPQTKLVFNTDKEKALLSGITVADIAATLESALGGSTAGTIRLPRERHPLRIEVRLPRASRSAPADLARLHARGRDGHLVPLSELGRWEQTRVDQTIYHKNLQQVVYVFAEAAGRPPVDAVLDIEADRVDAGESSQLSVLSSQFSSAGGHQTENPELGTESQLRTASHAGSGWVADAEPRLLGSRTLVAPGGGIPWSVPGGIRVDFAGEGEWKMTLEVFRDLGIAFGVALMGIYIILVAQTHSFVIPLVVMMAIPLTILGIMPGFWLLNLVGGGEVGGYAAPIFFTATGMIGMIALAGIVTRDSIILVDFIHLSLARGRTLFDAIMESRVVRLRPILLTSATAMLSALPIITDPVFSGLAWALIFGLLASTLFTLFVIPVTYWLLYANRPGHGLPHHPEEPPASLPAGKEAPALARV